MGQTLFVTRDNGYMGVTGEALVWKKSANPTENQEQSTAKGKKPQKPTSQKNAEEEQKIVPFPIHSISDVVVVGKSSLSTPCLQLLSKYDIPVHYTTEVGQYIGTFTSGTCHQKKLRRLQYEYSEDKEFCADIARQVIIGKLTNQMHTVARASNKETVAKNEKAQKEMKRVAREIKSIIGDVKKETELDKLRGYEGLAAAKYFSIFTHFLTGNLGFAKREKRPPKDPVNALLSLGYTLLAGTATTAILQVGLDPSVGWLHPEFRDRQSASLDLMEEFRSVIVDRLVIGVLNQGILNESAFEKQGSALLLKRDSLRRFIAEYAKRLNTVATNAKTEQEATYREHIYFQAKALAKAIQGKKKYHPFLLN